MPHLTPQQALDLAMDHHAAGRFAEAENFYRKLLAVEPGNPDIIHLLGAVAANTNRQAEGLVLMERAIAMNPNVARYHSNLGTLLLNMRDYDRAITCYQEALRLDPNCAGAYYNMGLTRFNQRRWDESIAAYRAALRLQPDYPACELNLGSSLVAAGQIDAAIGLYRSVLQRRPGDAPIATNLGNCLKEKGELDAAIEVYRHALAIAPGDAPTWNNLGVALKDQGMIEGSIAAFQHSLELQPGSAEVRSNLVFTMLFDPRCEPAALAAEEREWNRHHVAPLRAQFQPHANDRSPERRLRVGYVSADFREHVVGRALLPVFERHDREKVEVVCYAVCAPDPVTRRFVEKAALWRDVADVPDAELAARIRDDGIDILVDLALHTSDNRLKLFAHKPAPVQVSWLGYPGSSGVETIDWRITDPFLEPPGGESSPSAEQPFRLPHCWSCYEPPAGSPPVNALPVLSRGFFTFGSLNNFCKINDTVLETWARILGAVAESRLVLLTKTGSHRSRMADFMRAHGIAPERFEFLDYRSSAEGLAPGDYLRRYERIDLALDTFPYNGMTTTFDALWMGVPVVSLVGKFSLGRAGLSILSNVGLSEFAVESRDDYVRCAVESAHKIQRLVELRTGLRSRLQASPLLDPAALTREVEAAYRAMWRCWCGTQSAALPGAEIR
ncbi:MAG: tetratricopeptide repeat protein [Chthoniobacteraceae bacterium]